ncbi:hypothetical protein ES288_A01G033600v1 [Gossypium darwinii]|nr:hypothetical protein ES288_A01G033600v1 [Gossypium darwinii]
MKKLPSNPGMLKRTVPSSSQQLKPTTMRSTLKIGLLTINPKQEESKPSVDADAVETVTVGSMAVKVNGFTESSGYLTFGTIPHNPKTLQPEGGTAEKGSNCG